MVAGGNLSEYAKLVLSGTLADTDTAIAGGLTVTATGGVVTAAQVITALLTGTDVGYAVVTGTLSGWELVADPSSTTTLWVYSTTALTNVADFAVTGTNTSLTETVTTVAGSTTFQKPAGILCFDVDATSSDVEASMYTGVFAYESELIWGVDTTVDTITKADGTTVACTTYNTGAVTPLLRQLYVENTEFELMTPTAGEELANG